MSKLSKNPLQLCDPHFHLFRPNPNLGKVETYVATNYAVDMEKLPAELKRVSGLHVETVVGQMPGGAIIDSVDETRWVCSQLSDLKEPFGIVAFVHLARPAKIVESEIEEHLKITTDKLRGIRMILNYHSTDPSLTWSQVEHDQHTSDTQFHNSLGLLSERNLSFDLSCHPHQVDDAIKALSKEPDLRVVVNHLGFLRNGEDHTHEELWRKSLHRLAELPNVYMKLSMLWFARHNFIIDPNEKQFVRDRVLETVEIFKPDRCMFASNYPVDRARDIDISTLYGLFLEWTNDFSRNEREALFHDTALRAYGGKL